MNDLITVLGEKLATDLAELIALDVTGDLAHNNLDLAMHSIETLPFELAPLYAAAYMRVRKMAILQLRQAIALAN